LILRYRLSPIIERQQIKWIAFAASFISVSLLVLNFFSDPTKPMVEIVIGIILLSSLPLAIAIAILRYNLWDIDLIIRRTLQYTLVTGLLALVYFGTVLIFENLLVGITGQGSQIVIVISTLTIATLFNPLRTRVQDFIDRRFYRKKYNAEQALTKFATIARDEVDIDRLTTSLLGVVEETIQPETTSLWIISYIDH
jgi:amino acid transporter